MKQVFAAICLMLAGSAHAGTEPVRTARAPSVSYADAIRCQAFYALYPSLLEHGSKEYKLAASVFDAWDGFIASAYPGFMKDRDSDLFGEIERIDSELGKAADQTAAEKIMAGYMDNCSAIEPFAV